jgi:hypothetical protein
MLFSSNPGALRSGAGARRWARDSPETILWDWLGRELLEIFLDEAGYTGSDLASRDQPVYVLASTVLTDTEAAEVFERCFSGDRGREIKHSRIARTKKGRARVVDFVRRIDRQRVGFFAAHKEFVILSFLVDFWVEPIAHRDGINLYDKGGNIAMCNVMYITLGATMGADGRRELLRRSQVMHRDRTAFSYDSFWSMLYDAVRQHPVLEQIAVFLISAEQRLGWVHLQSLPRQLLDVGDLFLLDTVNTWRQQFENREFHLIHDTSKAIDRRRATWDAILDPNNPSRLVGQDRRTFRFPLPVRKLSIEESHERPSLQLADIVAGAACELMMARAQGRSNEYGRALEDAGLLQACRGGVWPTSAVSPEALETDGPVHADAATFIGQVVGDHKNPDSD